MPVAARRRPPIPDPPSAKQLVGPLLDWYAAAARPLPWRETRDPYAIWVSEIMLQQTQVATVIPYWQRWMKVLPDIPSLANASEARVLKLWEGLGYYRRARHLRQAAQCIMRQHNQTFPADPHTVLSLPGVGRYTAGAICSLAFDLPTPIVDGNVLRVLTRVFGIDGPPQGRPVQDRLWQLAQVLVTSASTLRPSRRAAPRRRAFLDIFGTCGNFNQALMELGALICTPDSPRCTECPWTSSCFAFRHQRQASLPNTGPRETPTARRHAAVVLSRDGRHLVRQRPDHGVNARLWEFPGIELRRGRRIEDLIGPLGLDRRDLTRWMIVRHSITRYRITLTVYRVDLTTRNGIPPAQGRWVTPGQMARLPFTGAHRRVVAALLKS